MSRTKAIQKLRDESPDLEAKIITAIGQAGPRNVAQISRMTGAHQETIRYKIKKRFERLGFKFHAEVDFDKLGLSLHWGSLDFARPYYDMAPRILKAMNEVGYLTYFGKLVPQGNYVTLFALPEGTTEQYRGFLSGLVAKGILRGFDLEQVAVSKHKAMDPRFFNFRSGRWEVEWDKVAGQPPSLLPTESEPKIVDFDLYDLLVIKELQKNSLQHLTDIARKLKLHQKTLEYHYRTHIQKWKLVPSYRIRWAQDLVKRPVHSTVIARLAFRGLGRQEFKEVQAAVSKIPFLWVEDLLRNGDYITMLYVPVADMVNMSSYINSAVPNLTSKLELSFVKPTEAFWFTIPYNMRQNGEWRFNVKQMERTLQKASTTPFQK